MTIGGWVVFGLVALFSFVFAFVFITSYKRKPISIIVAIILAIAACGACYIGERWYFTSTASGIRKITDERSNLRNGLERTINVYTANGDKIAEYHGKIDLETDKDYVKFDFDGKRYIYYNCFVETIADIP